MGGDFDDVDQELTKADVSSGPIIITRKLTASASIIQALNGHFQVILWALLYLEEEA